MELACQRADRVQIGTDPLDLAGRRQIVLAGGPKAGRFPAQRGVVGELSGYSVVRSISRRTWLSASNRAIVSRWTRCM